LSRSRFSRVVGPAIAAEPFSIKQLDQDYLGGHGQG
jgi:hypothetical protein